MPATSYRFVDRWTIPDETPDAVWRVISDARLLPEWWGDVFLSAVPITPDDEPRVGGKARLKIRGFLPYGLDFEAVAIDLQPGRLVEVEAHGDFEGKWRMDLSPHPRGTQIDIDWTLSVYQPFVRRFSPVLKPLFRWNHDWSAVRGEAGLRRYMAARRCGNGTPLSTPAPAAGRTPPGPRGPALLRALGTTARDPLRFQMEMARNSGGIAFLNLGVVK